MLDVSKAEQVMGEMLENNIKILGLSETRWKDEGEIRVGKDCLMVYSRLTGEKKKHTKEELQ